ncbi:MAG TPA: hypothetical protein VK581_06190 [Chthoniobacterales bacterium]|nr:hypothetical protein [Chthoniobacterales bacterium]
MKIKVVTVRASEIDQLEQKLNTLLGLPDFKGFSIAASFPSADASLIILILQKNA